MASAMQSKVHIISSGPTRPAVPFRNSFRPYALKRAENDAEKGVTDVPQDVVEGVQEVEKKIQAEERIPDADQSLGFVGNLVMWTILAVLMGASLFFTTARSFLPNDMQPLDMNDPSISQIR